jgi:hypothetical protein
MRALVSIMFLMVVSTTIAIAGDKPAAKESFDFLYATGRGTRLDTYHATITKDMIELPDTTVACVLSEADLDSVRDKMIEIHFFKMQEPHPDMHFGDPIVTQEPHTSIEIQATLGSRTEHLFWSTQYVVPSEGDWKKLGELEVLIWRILKRQPAYKALPPARGGYL